MQAAIQAGDVTVKINKDGKKRYWIHDEVEDDLETITGTHKLHGKMELSKQQWGFSFRLIGNLSNMSRVQAQYRQKMQIGH